MEYSLNQLGSAEHIELAREVAEKSMVLLKNKNKILPLDKTSIKKMAVIGHFSDVENTGDKGSSHVRPEYVVTPLQGIKNYVGKDIEVVHYAGDNPDSIKSIVKDVDAVIMIAGFDFHDEGEYIIIEEKQVPRTYEEEMVIQKKGKHKFLPFDGKDRLDLHLKERDVKAIKAIAETNDNLIVGLISGSAIMMEEWQDDAEGILMMWYSGMEGGNALANILFGDVNPSGKLPFTIPADESQLTTFDGFAETVNYEYYHGYTKVNKMGVAPAFPFGFGLSYTDFTYDSLKVEPEILSIDGTLDVSVMVNNTGAMEGEEVVQMYVGFKNSAVDRPVKLLRGFEKTNLKPMESKRINFTLPVKELAWYNPVTNNWEIEEMEYEVYVGPSSDDQDLLTSFFTIKNP
jgi:beta-glucosidase